MKTLSISSLSLPSSAALALIGSANFVPAKPSCGAKCHLCAYLRVCSSTKRNFGSKALCLTMAFHALLSLSRRNCASMCGAKGCGDLDCPLDRGFVRPSVRCVKAPDHRQVCVHDGLAISLGDLKQHALRTARGQKIAYVVA